MHQARMAKPALLFSFLVMALILAACSRAPVSVISFHDPLLMDARVLTLNAEAPGQFTGSWAVDYRTPIFMPISLAQTQSLTVDADSGVRWIFAYGHSADVKPFVAPPATLLATAAWQLEVGNSSESYKIELDVPATVVLRLVACTSENCWYEHADPLADENWLSFTVHKTELPEIRSGWPGPLARFRVAPTLNIQLRQLDQSLPENFATLTLSLEAGEAQLTYLR